MRNSNSIILLVQSQDRPGITAKVTDFVHRYNGNIINADQHLNSVDNTFFMRVQWVEQGFSLARDKINEAFFNEVASQFQMQWECFFSDEHPSMAVFVSKLPHCLYDILARFSSNEWPVKIPLIISNHSDLAPVAKQFGIDFHHIPVSKDKSHEIEQLKLLKQYHIDFVVLARYMQVLSANFIQHYPEKIINIHHSFLPAFAGAKPYHMAHLRGVKIIGATSHYVTDELDAGPIIEQDTTRVNHQDEVDDLIRKGRDLEKIVLARAIWYHLQHQVLVHNNRTITFI